MFLKYPEYNFAIKQAVTRVNSIAFSANYIIQLQARAKKN